MQLEIFWIEKNYPISKLHILSPFSQISWRKKRHTVFYNSYTQVHICITVVSQLKATTYDPKTVHDQSLFPVIPDQLFPQVLSRRLKKVRKHNLSVGPYLWVISNVFKQLNYATNTKVIAISFWDFIFAEKKILMNLSMTKKIFKRISIYFCYF